MSSLPDPMSRLQLTEPEAAPAQWPMDLTQLLADFADAPKLPDGLPEPSIADEIWTRHMRRCQPPLTCPVDELRRFVEQWERKFYSMEQDDEAELERLKTVLRKTPEVTEFANSPIARLPPPPLEAREHTTPFLLGWARTPTWQGLFLKACVAVKEEQLADRPWVVVSNDCHIELSRRTGGCYIADMWAVRPDLPLWSDEFSSAYYERLPITDVVMIKTTVGLARFGPTEAQYAWLKEVLGEPRWFRYPYSLEGFKEQKIVRPGI
ncbi:hypothetical protein TRAPUB_9933 [Trametes pubescens]|uniref:Uncharacterized protein n=1 Tax=Trametes pubescens TaxID=154538 RepID=A0A1M2W0Y1_TRAPU|nr:hypothetical protein TRAPUB_9933 [Trametes pubescens]